MNKAFFWLALIVLVELAMAPASQAQNPAEGKKLYSTYCSTCHGEMGKGDGVAGRRCRSNRRTIPTELR